MQWCRWITVLILLLSPIGAHGVGPDLNGDGYVGVEDVVEIAERWQPQASPEVVLAADLTGDGAVDDQDLLLLLRFWGKEAPPRSFQYDWGARYANLAIEHTVLDPESLSVVSFSGEQIPDASGLVSLDLPDVTAPAFVVVSNAWDNPVLLGFGLSESTSKLAASLSTSKGRIYSLDKYTLKDSTPVPVSVESTALALCLLNPMLWGVAGAERAEFASYLKTRIDFSLLLQAIQEALSADPDDPLNDEKHPEILDLAADISVSALLEWSGGSMKNVLGLDPESKDEVSMEILDDSGGNSPAVIFRNHEGVHYGVGLKPCGGAEYDPPAFLIDRVDTVLSFHLQWPPVTFWDPTDTRISVEDGTRDVYLFKGFDSSEPGWFNPSQPAGLGTWGNVVAVISFTLDQAVGLKLPLPKAKDLEALDTIFDTVKDLNEVAEAMETGEVARVLETGIELVYSHRDEIFKWVQDFIKREFGSKASKKFLGVSKNLGKKILPVLQGYDAINEGLPLVHGLVFAPSKIQLKVCQQGGKLLTPCGSDCSNSPPRITSVNSVRNRAARVGEQWRYVLKGVDADGDTLSATVQSGPSSVTIFPLGGNSFEVRYTPVESDLGGSAFASKTLALEVSDNKGGTDSQDISLTIQRGLSFSNRAPYFTTIPQTVTRAGQLYRLYLNATDADGDGLIFGLEVSPQGMTLEKNPGGTPYLRWRPSTNQVGPQRVKVSLKDDVLSYFGGIDAYLEFTLVVTTQPTPGEVIEIPLPNLPAGSRPLRLVRIPAGDFLMGNTGTERDLEGCSDLCNSELPQHLVTINYGFYMGETEVTQAQWQAVMGSNPTCNSDGPNNPVECVSWEDCQAFITQLEGRVGGDFHLPSEAEWEYACRGSASNPHRYAPFSFSDNPSPTDLWSCQFNSLFDKYMWWCGNAGGQPHEVAQKLPNSWGLYDMYGNVWEWCQDYWHDIYNNAPDDGNAWEDEGDVYRVLRGSDWYNHARMCRSASRNWSGPSERNAHIGFRLAKTP